jgi:hypothetical protein
MDAAHEIPWVELDRRDCGLEFPSGDG